MSVVAEYTRNDLEGVFPGGARLSECHTGQNHPWNAEGSR